MLKRIIQHDEVIVASYRDLHQDVQESRSAVEAAVIIIERDGLLHR
jgi:hypothetical protein